MPLADPTPAGARALADEVETIIREHVYADQRYLAGGWLRGVPRAAGLIAVAAERAALRAGSDPGGGREAAESFARQAHAGQLDKAGKPYTGHLGRVAARARAHAEALGLSVADAERCEIVGWLHDVIEDCMEDTGTLQAAGFDAQVVRFVDALSHHGSTWGSDAPSYEDYINWIARHDPVIVRIVKLADLDDNLDPSRGASLPDSLRRRYVAAREVLIAALPASSDTRATRDVGGERDA